MFLILLVDLIPNILSDNPYVIEEKGHKVMKVPTTNKQYGYDEKHQLYGILEQEFGYRDPLPLAIARLCKEYKTESGNESLCWIGCGTGIGPMHLHNVFQNVRFSFTIYFFKIQG